MSTLNSSSLGLQERLAHALDKLAIREVLVQWNRALDRGDIKLMASVYCSDAYDDHGKQQYASAQDAASDYIARHLSGARRTMHTTVQEHIELHGDAAHCESYAVAYLVIDRVASLDSAYPAREGIDEMLATVGIRYVDQMRREGDQWKIARRKMILEWRTFSDSVPLAFKVADQKIGFGQHGPYQGARTRDDPSYDLADQLARLARSRSA